MNQARVVLIARAMREFEMPDLLVANISDEDWERPLIRPESKDPWTVKDALAHITYWKAGVVRSALGQRATCSRRKSPVRVLVLRCFPLLTMRYFSLFQEDQRANIGKRIRFKPPSVMCIITKPAYVLARYRLVPCTAKPMPWPEVV
jgi:hypothetical protein